MEKYYLKGANGQLYVYVDHIEIKRKGILGKLSHLHKEDTYLEYTDLESVKLRFGSPLFSGYFSFKEIGEKKNKNLISAAVDENCIVFRFYENKNALEIRKYIDERIDASR